MNADPLASFYRWFEYAAFGRSLEQCRFHFMRATTQARHVLILGEGDGRFLSRFLLCNQGAHVDVIDRSAGMLALARKRVRLEDRTRVRFHRADVRDWEFSDQSYDLIVTQFFLDCFSPQDAAGVIARLKASLRGGGVWLVSEFQLPPHGLARLHARMWLRAMHLFFRLSTGLRTNRLPPFASLLERTGLTLIDRHELRFGLMVSQIWMKGQKA